MMNSWLVFAVIGRSQGLQSDIPKQVNKSKKYDFCEKVVLPGDWSIETPKNHFIEPLSSNLNFSEKHFLKDSAKSEDVEKYISSSTHTHMNNLLPLKSLLQ